MPLQLAEWIHLSFSDQPLNRHIWFHNPLHPTLSICQAPKLSLRDLILNTLFLSTCGVSYLTLLCGWPFGLNPFINVTHGFSKILTVWKQASPFLSLLCPHQIFPRSLTISALCEAVEKGNTLNLVPDQARHGTCRDLATPGERQRLTKEEKLTLACTELPQAGTVVLGWMSQPVIAQKQPRLPASAGGGAVHVKAANSTTTVDTTRGPGADSYPTSAWETRRPLEGPVWSRPLPLQPPRETPRPAGLPDRTGQSIKQPEFRSRPPGWWTLKR